MATINKRGEHQYQAIVRKKGYPSQTKTFETRREAVDWIATVEADMTRSVFTDSKLAERLTLGEALTRYSLENTPEKRSASREILTIRRWLAHPLSMRSIASLRLADFKKYSTERSKEVGPASVRIELAVISNLYTVMDKDWEIPVKNPILKLKKPKLDLTGRQRRFVNDEEKRLLVAASDSHVRTPFLRLAIVLAIETGMRAGELVGLRWEYINWNTRTVTLPATKNGTVRKVPLSQTALNALKFVRVLTRISDDVMDFHDSNGLSAAFRRACARASIEGLRFHDLRHEAASRFAPRMQTPTLAKLMGWKTLQMSMRYYNPSEEEMVKAIDDVVA
jgi:integrase